MSCHAINPSSVPAYDYQENVLVQKIKENKIA